jgi:DNA-binding NarL/FixJ family response regulator
LARIRVVIADVPQMLLDILHLALDEHPDIEIVSEMPRGTPDLESRLHGQLAATPVDVLILDMPSTDLSELGHRVLYRQPRLQVLAILGDGRAASRFELLPHRTDFDEPSMEGLVDAVRAAYAATVVATHGGSA